MPSESSRYILVGADTYAGRWVATVAADAGLQVRRANAAEPVFSRGDHVFCLPEAGGDLDDMVGLVQRVCRSAERDGVARLVLLSSLGVYGKTRSTPVTPETVVAPESPYAAARLASEELAGAASAKSGFELVIIRPPMVFGEPGSSFRTLAKLLKTGVPVPVGAARSRRTFCGARNLASAILHAGILAQLPGRILLPGDAADLTSAELCASIRDASAAPAPWTPHVPIGVIRFVLSLLGKRQMYESLFEPLTVDRGHWRSWSWEPATGTIEGLREIGLQTPALCEGSSTRNFFD